MAGIGQDLKKIYSDETRIVENASLCTAGLFFSLRAAASILISPKFYKPVNFVLLFAKDSV